MLLDGPERLGPRTIVPAIVEHVRGAILRGELLPGQKINQNQVAERLGISRIPLREALMKLAETGFVVIYPHRGAIVAPLSAEEIEENYLIRTRLETLAARLAAYAMSKACLAKLDEVIAQTEQAIAAGEWHRLPELNREFHRLGYQESGRPLLCRLIEELRDRSERYRSYHARITDRPRVALAEHREILAAWRRQDPDAAERAVQVNMENSARALISEFASKVSEIGSVPSSFQQR